MPLELPEELLALIVDFVTENKDKRTLSRLALVSRALLTHVRQHRSAEIKIIITAGACTCLTRRYVRRLRDIIVADPSFAACITSIHLVEQSTRRMGGGSFEWLTRSDADGLADILQSLVSLRRLSVINESDDFVFDSTSTDWRLIDVAVQRALLDLFSLPSLETLVLKRITNMELTPLIGRSNLKELTLRSVSLSDRDLERMQAGGPVASLSVGERASKGRLESIEFAGCGLTLQKLLTSLARDDAQLDASYLRRLRVHSFLYDSAAESAIQELLLKCAVHLERLSFHVYLRLLPERPQGELRALDCLRLHQLPLVQTLDVEFQILWYFKPIPQPYTDAIVTALRNLSHESLQVLRLTFTLQCLGPPTLLATDARNTSKAILEVDLWEQMDSMAGECLAGMESLEIVIQGKRRSPDLANQVNNLYSRMPTLSSKNILHVNWYVDLAVILFDFVERNTDRIDEAETLMWGNLDFYCSGRCKEDV
ncbi:hypothetical protein D9611_009049 [Ephemerocybe angulata]|uniref:F-box domain-containing protein n=1 Tax=Ephemerocybe angulata TaxID=980116 RepID=A0A8H5CFL2_9AGAR|nr:hypothetical protein D9611_009049 [Tulosesus angulatus]